MIFVLGWLLSAQLPALSDEQSQLLAAVRTGKVDVATALVKKGIDVNFARGASPLLVAVGRQDLGLVKLLLSYGADVNFFDEQQHTVLIMAIDSGNLELFKLIMAQEPDLNTQSRAIPLRTPLMQAAENGEMEMARLLVEAGADIHIEDYYEDQALAFAAYHNRPEVVEFLVASGAELNHVSSQNRTPLDHARRKGLADAKQILLNLGAKAFVDLK